MVPFPRDVGLALDINFGMHALLKLARTEMWLTKLREQPRNQV